METLLTCSRLGIFPISDINIKKLTAKDKVKIERKSIFEILNFDIEVKNFLVIFTKFIWNFMFDHF